MKHVQDRKRSRLLVMTGESEGSIRDLEIKWLATELVTDPNRPINDLWDLFLVMNGYVEGSLQDRQMEWLGSLGHAAPDLNGRWYQYWSSPI